MLTAKEALALSTTASNALTATLEIAEEIIRQAALLCSTSCSIRVDPEVAWLFQLQMKRAGYRVTQTAPCYYGLDWSKS